MTPSLIFTLAVVLLFAAGLLLWPDLRRAMVQPEHTSADFLIWLAVLGAWRGLETTEWWDSITSASHFLVGAGMVVALVPAVMFTTHYEEKWWVVRRRPESGGR